MFHIKLLVIFLTIGLALAVLPNLIPWSLYNDDKVASLLAILLRGTKRGSMNPSTSTGMARTPVYFLSHGGPNIMEDYDHPAHKKLKEIVNTAESMGLIYDYHGFPPHYYDFQFPNTGSKALAEQLLALFKQHGIKAEGVRRGLDHGVFAPFRVAFDPEKNPLQVPIVQVSLFDSDDPDQHYRLGQAVQSLRDEGVLIIVSGMAVHNIRDFWRSMDLPMPLPYATSFDGALKEAVEQPPEKRQEAMAGLMKRSDARKAHPTFEHLLPIYIGAGAAGTDLGKQFWTMPEGSVSWAQYRFGEIGA